MLLSAHYLNQEHLSKGFLCDHQMSLGENYSTKMSVCHYRIILHDLFCAGALSQHNEYCIVSSLQYENVFAILANRRIIAALRNGIGTAVFPELLFFLPAASRTRSLSFFMRAGNTPTVSPQEPLSDKQQEGIQQCIISQIAKAILCHCI